MNFSAKANTNVQAPKKKNPKGVVKVGGMTFVSKSKMIPTCIETAQASIPIASTHEKYNIIEPYQGCYTKTYEISNINYQTASETEQDSILVRWRAFLNSLGPNMDMALTVFNRPLNIPYRQG